MTGKDQKGVRATVRVHLVNPESGYESETTAQVTAAEWVVIDRTICAHDPVYPAAPALLEAAKGLDELYTDGLSLPRDASELSHRMSLIRAAIQSATGEG